MTDEGDLKKFETYGEEFEEAKKLAGEECEFLWTIVEAGDKWYLLPGFHLVNRMCYVICKNPWKADQRSYLYS